MNILLSSCLLSLAVSGQTAVASAEAVIAQATAPKKKAIRPRPTVPDTKNLRKTGTPEDVTPAKRGGSRYQPLKPTIRPRGVKPSTIKRPGERPGTIRPEKTPPDRSKHIRTPPMGEDAKAPGKRGPEGKGGAAVIEKDEKCRPLPSRVRVKMNFNEAEVIEIVQWISKQTCKNFIIGDSIRGGKITILSNTAVTANEASVTRITSTSNTSIKVKPPRRRRESETVMENLLFYWWEADSSIASRLRGGGHRRPDPPRACSWRSDRLPTANHRDSM